MRWFRKFLILAAVVVAAGSVLRGQADAGRAAQPLLPPEPTTGDWLRDTLEDDSLWFAASKNLVFEPMPAELSGYPAGRRWVGVDGEGAAWVMYYVPGELLGFEADTHHYAAGAIDFEFLAGADYDALAPVDVATELVAYEAKWLRLFHTNEQLPPGTRFLLIRFPQGGERNFARLTEVWLRCRFDASTAPPAAAPAPSPLPHEETHLESADATANPDAAGAGTTPDPPAPPTAALAPFHVYAERYEPPLPASLHPAAPEVTAVLTTPRIVPQASTSLALDAIRAETKAAGFAVAEAAAPPPDPALLPAHLWMHRGPRSK